MFCDVNTDAGKAAETELQTKYGVNNVIFTPCDVTDAEQLQGTDWKFLNSTKYWENEVQ